MSIFRRLLRFQTKHNVKAPGYIRSTFVFTVVTSGRWFWEELAFEMKLEVEDDESELELELVLECPLWRALLELSVWASVCRLLKVSPEPKWRPSCRGTCWPCLGLGVEQDLEPLLCSWDQLEMDIELTAMLNMSDFFIQRIEVRYEKVNQTQSKRTQWSVSFTRESNECFTFLYGCT